MRQGQFRQRQPEVCVALEGCVKSIRATDHERGGRRLALEVLQLLRQFARGERLAAFVERDGQAATRQLAADALGFEREDLRRVAAAAAALGLQLDQFEGPLGRKAAGVIVDGGVDPGRLLVAERGLESETMSTEMLKLGTRVRMSLI